MLTVPSNYFYPGVYSSYVYFLFFEHIIWVGTDHMWKLLWSWMKMRVGFTTFSMMVGTDDGVLGMKIVLWSWNAQLFFRLSRWLEEEKHWGDSLRWGLWVATIHEMHRVQQHFLTILGGSSHVSG